jgi:hypothetical protein
MPVDLVHDLAIELLETAGEALSCEGIELPPLRYVSHGRPPWDCELLAVHVDPPHFFTMDTPTRSCAVALRYTLHLTILRCWPVPKEGTPPILPTGPEMTAAAEVLNTDAHVLMRTLGRRHTEAELFPGLADCKATRLERPFTLEPSGGLAGWVFPVTVQPTDTDPLCGS